MREGPRVPGGDRDEGAQRLRAVPRGGVREGAEGAAGPHRVLLHEAGDQGAAQAREEPGVQRHLDRGPHDGPVRVLHAGERAAVQERVPRRVQGRRVHGVLPVGRGEERAELQAGRAGRQVRGLPRERAVLGDLHVRERRARGLPRGVLRERADREGGGGEGRQARVRLRLLSQRQHPRVPPVHRQGLPPVQRRVHARRRALLLGRLPRRAL